MTKTIVNPSKKLSTHILSGKPITGTYKTQLKQMMQQPAMQQMMQQPAMQQLAMQQMMQQPAMQQMMQQPAMQQMMQQPAMQQMMQQPSMQQNFSRYTKNIHKTRIPGETKQSTFTTAINVFQFVLDFVGIFPPFGWVADISSLIISVLRGQYTNAMFSAISVIPLAGNAVGKPLKYIRKLR
jgi:hypothetical protein